MINDSKLRKQTPLYFGLMVYFPDALEAVAQVSYVADRKHNPGKPEGEPPHWNRTTSTDEYDAAARHLNDRAKGVEFDPELSELAGRKIRTMACAAWRNLAALQKEIEAERAKAEPKQQVWLHDKVVEPSVRDDEAAFAESFKDAAFFGGGWWNE